jgi:spermidine synthase
MEKFINKHKLEAIVFVGGTCVMILELIGSRIFAPYLGTSIYVWTSLIGIILGALSLGYFIGGRLSEKNPSFNFLTNILFIAGFSIAFIPIFKTPVLEMSMQLGVKTGSVLATILLFVFPSILMGIISPYAIRLSVEALEKTGNVAGRLYALSTIGSIFGTFLAGFYLVPAFGSTSIVFGISIVLIITSLAGNKKLIKLLALTVVFAIFYFYNNLPNYALYEADSEYNHIRVVNAEEKSTGRPLTILYLATEMHSIMYRDSDELFANGYSQMYLLDSLFKPEINNALTLGGGAYLAPRNFLKRHPDALMTVVEIDPAVTEVAKKYFNLPDDPRLKIIHQDGRIFLNQNQEQFDIVYGDAFASYYSIPFQLTTYEAMEKLANGITDEGVLMLNVISSLEGEKSLFLQAQYKTLQQFFNDIRVFPANYSDPEKSNEIQNIILIASKKPLPSSEELNLRANENQKQLLKQEWFNSIITNEDIPILTDEFAPVDQYISKFL